MAIIPRRFEPKKWVNFQLCGLFLEFLNHITRYGRDIVKTTPKMGKNNKDSSRLTVRQKQFYLAVTATPWSQSMLIIIVQTGRVFIVSSIHRVLLFKVLLLVTSVGSLFHSLIASLMHDFCEIMHFPNSMSLPFVHAIVVATSSLMVCKFFEAKYLNMKNHIN